MQNRVRELRKEHKLKQEELAAKINVSQQTISRIEKEENSVIEFNQMMEKNYELCQLYGRLDKAQQELLMRLAQELARKAERTPR